MRSLVYKSFVNRSVLQMLVVFLEHLFYKVRVVEASMLGERSLCSEERAGDGLDFGDLGNRNHFYCVVLFFCKYSYK